jgi:hypothetical protein
MASLEYSGGHAGNILVKKNQKLKILCQTSFKTTKLVFSPPRLIEHNNK